jgi:hypothetical protein
VGSIHSFKGNKALFYLLSDKVGDETV